MTTSQTTTPQTVLLEDPGAEQRLDRARRAELRTALKATGRSGLAAALLHVDGDAWAHRRLPADPTDAAGIGADQHALVRAVLDAPFPVVVHVAGRLSGLGLALALAADVRILGAQASVALDTDAAGLLAAGLPTLLRHRLGDGAAELLWTGPTLSASEAVGRGLATEVGEAEGASRIVESLAATPRSTSALHRSVSAGAAAELARRLEYDAWLAVVAVADAR